MSVEQDMTLVMDADAPADKLVVQFMLALCKEQKLCVVCLMNQLNLSFAGLVEAGVIHHGVDPSDLLDELTPKEEDGFRHIHEKEH